MNKPCGILMIIALAFFSCKKNIPNDQNRTIKFDRILVDSGHISGHASSDQMIYAFKGIPYAHPPIADLRWKPPRPVVPWDGVKRCNSFGASAMQPFPEPFYMWSEEFLIPKAPIDEDCLYLNVWTAAKKIDEKRPVIVWIHGGGFVSGSGSVPIYDGEAMARKGVVFVSINYRLGIFGFFAHPDLTQESTHNASGNYGLMDQIAALKWVKNNITSFGGDAENITIAGQSAGGASVVYLVASPLAKGLFQKAIVQSGSGLLPRAKGAETLALSKLPSAEQAGVKVTQQLKVTTIAQLRNIPARELQNQIRIRSHPIVDGYVLPENVIDLYRENKVNDVGLLTGWNEDDGIVMGGFEKADVFREKILSQWGVSGSQILRFYPATNDSTAARSQKKLQRDIVFGVQNYVLANWLSGHGKEVYVYRFTREVPPGQYEYFGAFHTAEVPYAYDNLKFFDRPFTSVDHQLAEVMSTYWINFATTGNPNTEGLAEWPKYNSRSQAIMVLGDEQKKGIIQDTLSLNFLQQEL